MFSLELFLHVSARYQSMKLEGNTQQSIIKKRDRYLSISITRILIKILLSTDVPLRGPLHCLGLRFSLRRLEFQFKYHCIVQCAWNKSKRIDREHFSRAITKLSLKSVLRNASKYWVSKLCIIFPSSEGAVHCQLL